MNSSTVVAYLTRSADESHSLWPRYNNSLYAVSYVYESMCGFGLSQDSEKVSHHSKAFLGGLDVDHTHLHIEKSHISPSLCVPFSSLSLYIRLHDGDLVKAPLQRLGLVEVKASGKGLS